MHHRREGLFLIGWILATIADMLDREPVFSKSLGFMGKQYKWSTVFSAGAIVFFFIALAHVGRE